MRNTTHYKIAGPKTFRLASVGTIAGHGGNLQNIEKSLRRIYIPDEGKIFVQVDQSGAEALIVAYLCNKGEYRKLFENKIKPHSYLAMRLFRDVWPKKMLQYNRITSQSDFDIDKLINCPIERLKQEPYWKDLGALIKDSDDWPLTERYYYLAKQTEHSSNYGIGTNRFQMNVLDKSGGKIVISKDQAEMFLATKHSLFPEIKDWHRSLRAQIDRTGILYNLHGHPYQVTQYEILDTQWKELIAWIPQASVGEITNIAYAQFQNFIEITNQINTVRAVKILHERVQQALDLYGAKKRLFDLLANTHDSYLSQCPIGEEYDCGKVKKFFIEQEFTSPNDGVRFKMGSEVVAGYNWAPYKKDINELGLREIQV